MQRDYKTYLNDVRQVMSSTGGNGHLPYIAVIDDAIYDRASLRNFVRACYNDIPVRTYRSVPHFCETLKKTSSNHAVRAVFLDTDIKDTSKADIWGDIRSMSELKDVPVYVMGRKFTDEALGEWLALGANDFIRKPLDFMALSLLIQKGDFDKQTTRESA